LSLEWKFSSISRRLKIESHLRMKSRIFSQDCYHGQLILPIQAQVEKCSLALEHLGQFFKYWCGGPLTVCHVSSLNILNLGCQHTLKCPIKGQANIGSTIRAPLDDKMPRVTLPISKVVEQYKNKGSLVVK
jgi:hypothetical protein